MKSGINRIQCILLIASLVIIKPSESLAGTDPYETNNDRDTAYQISFIEKSWESGGAVIDNVQDQDWFKFDAGIGDIVSITCKLTSNIDAALVLYQDDTKLETVDKYFSGVDEKLSDYPLSKDGTYYIGVGYYKTINKISKTNADVTGTYTLSVTLKEGCTITGRITDSQSGSGVDSATVTVFPGKSLPAVTDADGYYTIVVVTDPDVSSYTVTAKKQGYLPLTESDVTLTPGETTIQNMVLTFITDDNRYVLMEEFTGTWCGWCPYGADIIKEIKETQKNVIVLSYHFSDAMSTPEGDSFIDKLNPAYPMAAIDRVLFPGTSEIPLARSIWESKCIERSLIPPTYSISLQCDYDSTTREVDLAVDLCANTDLSGIYRVNVVVSEGSLNYRQNISDKDYDDIYPYFHEDVVREMITGAFGEVINDSPILKETCILKNYSFTLDSDYNDKNCHIVVFVHEDVRGGIGPVQQAVTTEIIPDDSVLVEGNRKPELLSLSQNHPNPFNPVTHIDFFIPNYCHAALTVYNVAGQKVKVLNDSMLEGGNHSFRWDATDMPSGLYFYTLKANGKIETGEMLLVK